MGQVISEFLGTSPEENVKEAIEILQKLVSAKLQAYAAEMEAKAFEDKSLPILAVVDKTEKYMVKVSEGTSANVGSVVDDLFNGEFLDGLKHLVKTAMNELLGNASAGEKEKRSAMWFMQITAFFESTTTCTNMISVLKAHEITRKMHSATWFKCQFSI